MSREQVKKSVEELARTWPKTRCVDEGEVAVVIIDDFPIPGDAYSLSVASQVAFIVPSTFPDAQPDPSGFYLKPTDFTVKETKAQPIRTSITQLLGENWLKFSWQAKDGWDSNKDSLGTFVANIEKRFLRKT
jgi:hypothetical protein